MRSDSRDFGEREASALDITNIDECKLWSEAKRTKHEKASTQRDHACCIAQSRSITRVHTVVGPSALDVVVATWHCCPFME